MANVADGQDRGLFRKIFLEEADGVAKDREEDEEAEDDGDRLDRIARHSQREVAKQQIALRNGLELNLDRLSINFDLRPRLIRIGKLLQKMGSIFAVHAG